MAPLRRIWAKYLLPLIRRPSHYQVAALCWRPSPDGVRILLLTSRETRRWILPKGWPKADLDAAGSAREEAWEEGGVRLEETGRHLGRYQYDKNLRDGPVGTEVDVFAFRVLGVEDAYPEAHERERDWVSPEEAASRVDEPSLSQLLSEIRDRLPPEAHATQ